MLVIPEEQKAALEEVRFQAFCAQMAVVVRHVLPEAVDRLSDAALLASVTTRVRQALAFGLTDKAEARRYLESSFALGWSDAGPPPWARAILEQPKVLAEHRMDQIELQTQPT